MRLIFLLLSIPIIALCDFPHRTSIDSMMLYYSEQDLFAGTVIVAVNGRIEYQKAFGFLDRESKKLHSIDSRLKIGSIAKDFTAVRILQLMEEGQLDLDKPMGEYIDIFPDSIARKVTIRHLLRHESGFGDYLPLAESQNSFRNLKTVDDIIDLVRMDPLVFEPGSNRRYSNSGYTILGAVIEALDGQPYHLSVKNNILFPVGMDATIFDWQKIASISHRSKWYIRTSTGRFVQPQFEEWPSPSGGAYSTVRDMLKFELTLFHTNELISDKSKVMIINEFKNPGALSWQDFKNREDYVFARAGGAPGNNSVIIHWPASKTIIIVLANYDEPIAEEVGSNISNILGGQRWDPPQIPIYEQAYFIFKQEGIDSLKSKMNRLVANAEFDNPPDLILNRVSWLLSSSNSVTFIGAS